MYRKLMLISSLLLTIVIVSSIYNFNNSKEIISNSTNKKIVNSNALTMMYETEENSGEYQVSSDSSWPQEGYIFNEKLSGCENGSKLTWDNESKRIIMQANTSDKCYVYFDKYIVLEITSVSATETTSNSITVSVSAIPGDGEIVSYHYAINDSEYVSSNSNTYIFENLNAETNYNIKVYVTDSNDRKSSNYNTNFTTISDLISFTVTYYNGSVTTFYSKKGLTWQEWIDSDYNTDNFYIDGSSICTNYILGGVEITDIIENGANYVASRFVCAPTQ